MSLDITVHINHRGVSPVEAGSASPAACAGAPSG